ARAGVVPRCRRGVDPRAHAPPGPRADGPWRAATQPGVGGPTAGRLPATVLAPPRHAEPRGDPPPRGLRPARRHAGAAGGRLGRAVGAGARQGDEGTPDGEGGRLAAAWRGDG